MRWRVGLGVLAGLGACVDADDRPASWSYLHAAIVAPSCATAGCHAASNAAASLDLSTAPRAYRALTGVACGEPPPAGRWVVPFDPAASPLPGVLRGRGVPLMPPDAPLATPELDLVDRWILEGAECD